MGNIKGIRQRGSKWFVDVTYDGKRKTATVGSFEEAVVMRRDLLDRMQAGLDTRTSRANGVSWTLQQALDKVLSMPKPEGWRGCSYEPQATLNVQDAITFMGPDIKLDRIDRGLIDAWVLTCEAKGNSDSTINRKVSALSKVLKTAVNHDGLAELPAMPKQRRERVGRIRYFTNSEETQMAAWCKATGQDEFWDVICVLIDTGMRRGELLNLRPADVDLKTGVMMVYGTEGQGTKNGKIRSVPMTKRVRAVMGRHLTGAPCFDVSESQLRHSWDRMKEHMGLTADANFVLHTCRHTCASRLVKAGVSLPVVQAWLGHSDIKTTMRYAHLFPADLMNAAKALEGDQA